MSEATPSATGGKLTNKPAFDIIHTKSAAIQSRNLTSAGKSRKANGNPAVSAMRMNRQKNAVMTSTGWITAE